MSRGAAWRKAQSVTAEHMPFGKFSLQNLQLRRVTGKVAGQVTGLPTNIGAVGTVIKHFSNSEMQRSRGKILLKCRCWCRSGWGRHSWGCFWSSQTRRDCWKSHKSQEVTQKQKGGHDDLKLERTTRERKVGAFTLVSHMQVSVTSLMSWPLPGNPLHILWPNKCSFSLENSSEVIAGNLPLL